MLHVQGLCQSIRKYPTVGFEFKEQITGIFAKAGKLKRDGDLQAVKELAQTKQKVNSLLRSKRAAEMRNSEERRRRNFVKRVETEDGVTGRGRPPS